MKKSLKELKLNEILNKTSCSLLVVLYMLTLCPFSAIAEEKRQEVYELPGLAVVQKELALAEEKTSSLLINATEGGTVTLAEASIQIPPNALSIDTQISITHIQKVADTGESLYNAIPNFRGYRFLTKVTQFQEGEYTNAPNSLKGNIVAPVDGKDGGGIEYINTVPLYPICCEELE